MAITAPQTPAPPEKPDPDQAKSRSGEGQDRPGFDLGGANDRSTDQSTVTPGGSQSPVPAGSDAAAQGGASGMSDGSGRTIGGTAGGSKPGEASQATAGAVRPPQTTSADQGVEQGNPDDAA